MVAWRRARDSFLQLQACISVSSSQDLLTTSHINEATNHNPAPITPVVPTEHGDSITPPLLVSYTPNGSEEWIREVEIEFTPTVGKLFSTLEEGGNFCRIYALACDFDIRLAAQKRFNDNTIRTKDIFCSRQRFRDHKNKIQTEKAATESEVEEEEDEDSG